MTLFDLKSAIPDYAEDLRLNLDSVLSESLAMSAINGCGMCMDSHEKPLRKHAVSAPAVQSAVRIAAVVHAVAVTLEQQSV